MASSTVGQLALFKYGASATLTPTRNTNSTPGFWGARCAMSFLLKGSGPSNSPISGYAHLNGSNAIRRILILTQPPNSTIVYEANTDLVTGTFSFPHLPAGNYMVIDA